MHLIQQQQPPLAAGYLIHDLHIRHHLAMLLQALVLPTGRAT